MNNCKSLDNITFPDCSIGCCITNLSGKFTETIQYLIRQLDPPYDHSCLFVHHNEKQYVIESTLNKGIVLIPFTEWIKNRNLNTYIVLKHRFFSDFVIDGIKKEAYCLIGKKYDKRAIYHHLIDKTAGKLFGLKWTGQTDAGRAEDKYYCSEWIAKLYSIKDWWRVTPSDLAKNENFKIVNGLIQ